MLVLCLYYCWAVRYLAWKHQQLLYLDILGGCYTLAIAAALTRRGLRSHPATLVLLALTGLKALPHLPLLLGFTRQHIRWVGGWV